MKIEDSIKKTPSLGVGTKQTATPGKGAGKTESGTVASVNVSVSSQMQALSSTVANSNVFDASKVEEIKSAIADGRFQVNAEKVADGLIDNVKDMLQRPKAS